MRTYGMNGMMGSTVRRAGVVDGEVLLRRSDLARVHRPEIYVFIDLHEDTIDICNVSVAGQPPNECIWSGAPANRHSRGGTLSFTDGHAIVKRWTDPGLLLPVSGEQRYGLNGTECTDWIWLWQRTTRKIGYPDPVP